MIKNHTKYSLIFLLIIGLIVRLIFIWHHGLSNDELSAWLRTNYDSFADLLNFGVKTGDMHPAFYQVLLWIWVNIFGDSEIAMRSLSLLFYVLTMLLIYRIGSQFYSKMAAILFISLYVGLTFTVLNTTFTRPYNTGAFFLMLAFYGILKSKKANHLNWKYIAFMSIGFAGAMYSHYFAFLTAIVLGFCGIFYLKLNNAKSIFIAGLTATLLFLPHLSITLHQLYVGGLQWLAKPSYMWPVDFTYLFFNNSWMLFAIITGLTGLNILWFKPKNINREQVFILTVPTLTFVIAFFISLSFTPILRDVAMVFILPFFILGIFSFFSKNGTMAWSTCFVFLVYPTIDSFFRNDILGPNHFGVFKELGICINNAVDEVGYENITFASNYNNVDYLNYYLKKDVSESIVDWEQQDAVYKLSKRVSDSKKNYFIYSVNNKYHTPMYLELIQRHYPVLLDVQIFGNSAYYLFGKLGESRIEKHQVARIDHHLSLDSNEFSSEGKFLLSEVKKWVGSNGYLKLSSKLNTNSDYPRYLVASVERDGAILMKGNDPVLYIAYDQLKLESSFNSFEMVSAFELPDNLRDNDILKIYLWNPKKTPLAFDDIRIESVETKP
jgi:hypothetical protein